MSHQIALIVGSLRKDSFSMKIALAIQKMAPSNYQFELVSIGDLPLYNQDYDDTNTAPEAYKVFRKKMNSVDGVIFVTPEYNRSVPAVLKNALDVGSRPYGFSVWQNKPAAIISQSPGLLAGFGANHHLRQSLVFLNMPTMQQPEAYISESAKLFDEAGNFIDDKKQAFFQNVIDAYILWFNQFSVSK